MKKKSVMVISQETDFHVSPVQKEILRRGFTVERIDLADFPLKMSFTAHLEGGTWKTDLSIAHSLEASTSIWYRRPQFYRASQAFSSDIRVFLEREAYYAFVGVLESCQLTCLVSSPTAIQRASMKAFHLATAQHYGLCIPRTLITNDPKRVHAFYEECHGHIICKAIYSNTIEMDDTTIPPRFIYTNLVTPEHLKNGEGIREAAHLFQEAFTNCRDIRVTIFGTRCVATEIIYTEPRLQVDWRTEYRKHAYIPHPLPHDVATKLLAFVKSYGLQFSTIDLLLVEDDRYYFIDENPNGQFYWLEQKNPAIHLAEAMADLLCFPQEYQL